MRSEPGGKDGSIHGKILIENLQFVGYHGVYEHERAQGQLFAVDGELEFDFPTQDELSETVDYARVIEHIRTVNASNSFCLLEAFAQTIAFEILRNFSKVQRVRVRVRKLHPPLPSDITLGTVAAEVICDRSCLP